MKATEETAPGILLIDKPEGPTSHDVVAEVRRAIGTRRVGHTGTLDPFASGLLILCVGKATRLAEYFHILPKTYEATLMLGRETDTDDRTGQTTAESDGWRGLDRESVAAAAAARSGQQAQVPPDYSARKVDGRRAHRRARAGEQVELAPTQVTVHSIEVTGWSPPSVSLDVTVSTGTYIRALARDLGRDLGCGAHLDSLRRTVIGPFGVDGALPAARLRDTDSSIDLSARLMTPAEALGWLPRRDLTEAETTEIAHGRAVAEAEIVDPHIASLANPAVDDLPVALVRDADLVAVARRDDGMLRPVKVLHAV
jgi:tRNA pseudouridine55 synthase